MRVPSRMHLLRKMGLGRERGAAAPSSCCQERSVATAPLAPGPEAAAGRRHWPQGHGHGCPAPGAGGVGPAPPSQRSQSSLASDAWRRHPRGAPSTALQRQAPAVIPAPIGHVPGTAKLSDLSAHTRGHRPCWAGCPGPPGCPEVAHVGRVCRGTGASARLRVTHPGWTCSKRPRLSPSLLFTAADRVFFGHAHREQKSQARDRTSAVASARATAATTPTLPLLSPPGPLINSFLKSSFPIQRNC